MALYFDFVHSWDLQYVARTMGQCLSLDHEELKARARSEAIDRDLQTWAKKDQNVIKILLLGKSYLVVT